MIYFIQDSRTFDIKIGYAGDVRSRIGALQTGNPGRLEILLVIDGEREDEAALHRQFCGVRTHGEWFRPGPDLIRLIAKKASEAAARKATVVADSDWEDFQRVDGMIVESHGDGVRVYSLDTTQRGIE